MRRSTFAISLLISLALLLPADALVGQSRTTSAIRGTVVADDGRPLAEVLVEIRNENTGATRTTLTNAEGGFLVLLLQPGGPYTLSATSLGFAEERREAMTLQVGEVTMVAMVMRDQAIELEGVQVSVERDEIFNPTQVGPATLLSERVVESVPLLSRDIMELALLSPLVKTTDEGGFSVAGQNDRYNAILVDGILNKDMFGLTSGGVPGGQAGAKLVPLDAVSQYEVLIAPFDVRLSGFTGGVMNAVTRSGTNEWRIRTAAVVRDETLMGDLVLPTGPVEASGVDRTLAAFSIGGPIVFDRGHFFVNGEFERRHQPPSGYNVFRDDPTLVRISPDGLSAFQDDFETNFGGETGTGEVYPLGQQLTNVFGRLDWHFEGGSRLTVRNVFAHANNDESPNRSAFEPYELSSNAVFRSSLTNSTSFQLFSPMGDWGANQLDFNVAYVTDDTEPASDLPQFEVELISSVDGSAYRRPIRTGGNYFGADNSLSQLNVRATNSIDFFRGDDITTLGVTGSLYDISHTFLPGSAGEYYFSSPNDIAPNAPARYQRTVLNDGFEPNADFGVLEWGLFAQHQMNPGKGLSMRFGIRVDVPHVLGAPDTNYDVLDYFGYDTGKLPSGNFLISPRWGFNWQSEGERRWQVRMGAGMFAGQMPYVWLSNAFHNDGLRSVTQLCQGRNYEEPLPPRAVPSYVPGSLPTSCFNGAPFIENRSVVVFREDFKYPQDLKFSVTADREITNSITATVGALFNKALNQIGLEELNIEPGAPGQGLELLGGFERKFYQPLNSDYNQVLAVGNDGEDWGASFSAELRGRAAEGLNYQLGYAYSRAWDRMSLVFSDMQSNFGFNPVEGETNRPRLTRSNFDRPHKFVATVYGRPFAALPDTEFSILYTGQSGLPFSMVYRMDVNGDGYPGLGGAFARNNDLIFVPDDAFDLPAPLATQQLMAAAMENDDCISQHIGQILGRNDCRSPFQHQLDLRIAHTLHVGQAEVRLEGDLINVLNLINGDWGRVESIQPVVSVLEECVDCGTRVVRWGGAVLSQRNEEGFLTTTDPYSVLTPDSQWQMQFGARVTLGAGR